MEDRNRLAKLVGNVDVHVLGRGTRMSVHRAVFALAVAAGILAQAGTAHAGAGAVTAKIHDGDTPTVTMAVKKPLRPYVPVMEEHDSTADMARALLGSEGPGPAEGTQMPEHRDVQARVPVAAPMPQATPLPSDYSASREVDSGLDAERLKDPGWADKSAEGIAYTLDPVLHDHVGPAGIAQIMEGGPVTRQVTGTHGNGLNNEGRKVDPGILDPSEAFMNIAVLTYMQNTMSELAPAIQAVERMQQTARACMEDFGPEHDCSVASAGIAFDYGKNSFTATLDVPAPNGQRSLGATRQIVAFERSVGLFKGPAFGRVAQSVPEVAYAQ